MRKRKRENLVTFFDKDVKITQNFSTVDDDLIIASLGCSRVTEREDIGHNLYRWNRGLRIFLQYEDIK
jgi:hypothetical protein